MEAIDSDKELEVIIRELTDIYYPIPEDSTLKKDNEFLQTQDEVFVARVIAQRLRGELKKYIRRQHIYAEQIGYIQEKIDEIENKYPEIRLLQGE